MSLAAAFTLVLFGCSDDGTACRRLDYAQPAFAAVAACNARSQDALESDAALRADYPTVVAKCLPAQVAARLDAGEYDLTARNLRRALAVR